MRYILRSRRRSGLLLIDLAIFGFCYYLSFVMRFESFWAQPYMRSFMATAPIAVLCGVAGMILAGIYRSMLRYTGIKDMLAIIRGAAYGAALFVMAIVFSHGLNGFPRSIFVLYPLLAVGAIGGSRIAFRVFVESREASGGRERARNALIVGAGDAAEDLLRELQHNPRTSYRIVGIDDDAPDKRSQRIHGVEVVGEIGEIPALVAALRAEEILIAIPSADGAQMRRIVGLCRESGADYRTVPGIGDILEGRVHVGQLRRVRIDDLLRRPSVQMDREAIEGYVKDKRVLVTGAGGSIGSELCRQLARSSPEELILVDHAENSLFFLNGELC